MKDVVESWLDGTRSHFPTMINVYSNTINEDNTMSTITMNNTATATFTAEMKEQLESVLISMLDSGTLTEEQAMEMNEANTLRELRIAALNHNLVEEIVHVIKVITGVYVNQPLPSVNTDVDLSEFFKCNTPEEAKALQSWADVFDVKITVPLTVVEEKPMIIKLKK